MYVLFFSDFLLLSFLSFRERFATSRSFGQDLTYICKTLDVIFKMLTISFRISFYEARPHTMTTLYINKQTLKAPNKNYSRRHFNFVLLSFEENKT